MNQLTFVLNTTLLNNRYNMLQHYYKQEMSQQTLHILAEVHASSNVILQSVRKLFLIACHIFRRAVGLPSFLYPHCLGCPSG
jgi:hypothetical protein